jgi:hypothetical protein
LRFHPRGMATLAQLDDQLTEVRSAISAVLTGGQALGVNGRTLSRASLAELREMERDLEHRIARINRGGIRLGRVVPK